MLSSNQDPPLGWEYLAGWFDVNGSVYEKRTGSGLEARLRFSSYDRDFSRRFNSSWAEDPSHASPAPEAHTTG